MSLGNLGQCSVTVTVFRQGLLYFSLCPFLWSCQWNH